MDNNERKINYEDMAKKLAKSLTQELNNLGYLDEESLRKYLDETANFDKQQLNQILRWIKYH